MNTLEVSNIFEKRTAPQNGADQSLGENAWYHGLEMGMAFCRVTEQLSSKPGTKVEKELRCLERIVGALGSGLVAFYARRKKRKA